MQRILLAEDSPAHARCVVPALTGVGYEVTRVASAEVGLEMIEAEPFDLIIANVGMTGVNGYDFCRALRSRSSTCDTPVLLLIPDADPRWAIDAASCGADSFLRKPFTDADLLGRVAAVFESQRDRGDDSPLTVSYRGAVYDLAARPRRAIHLLLSCFEDMSRARTRIHASQRELLESNMLLMVEAEQNKQTTAALARSEAMWRSLGENLPDRIVVIGDAGEVRFANSEAGGDALAASRSFDFLPAEHRSSAVEAASVARETGIVQTYEARGWAGDLQRWFSCRVVPFGDAGSDAAVLLVATDITERRQMDDMLLRSGRMEAISHLAEGIAHEINTPIQYIGDNINFVDKAVTQLFELLHTYERRLRQQPAADATRELKRLEAKVRPAVLREEIPRALAETTEGVTRIASIVRAMKQFVHTGKSRKAPADINAIVDEAATFSSNEWKYIADLETILEPSLPPVSCRAREIGQVVLHLIMNAAQAIEDASATKGKGRITVHTTRAGETVEIRVADTGTGIPAHVCGRIFDPFFTTKEVGKGTGQGLALAYAVVVEDHGGTLDFDTRDGLGTFFRIRLPLEGTENHATHHPRRQETTGAFDA